MKIYTTLLLLTFVTSANASIYKWTDSEGNVHFGDRPADGSASTEVKIYDNKNTGVTTSSGNTKEREYLLKKIDKDKKEEAKKRKEQLADNQKRMKLCDNYRRKYQVHIQSTHSYKMSPDGERTYLSEEQRDARKKQLESEIRKYCR